MIGSELFIFSIPVSGNLDTRHVHNLDPVPILIPHLLSPASEQLHREQAQTVIQLC